MTDTTKTETDRILAAYEAPASIVRQFRELVASNFQLAEQLHGDLRRVLDSSSNGSTKESPETPRKIERKRLAPRTSNFATVASLFVQNDNKYMSKKDIVKRSGLGMNSVHRLIYTTADTYFETRKSHFGREAGFRLSAMGLAKTRGVL